MYTDLPTLKRLVTWSEYFPTNQTGVSAGVAAIPQIL